ncbi:hypothetical protein V8B55DRAFT_1506696 [Mucor lusitanicus]|uniref:Ser-Thr-rich glycosyl-phosphatidyl-inositol-anchored membrane family-domain-containing protein n=2 Tax=Mucor circinelloides f. lusitanicus TaxID=29924 RepID=A0A168Q2A0_MUCCL|nr:hypothetical protein FB192DRAFT_1368748 [Mucor lusitanicus]OAD08585.1 hypothetical protein MUCCIDRAFT_105552 [Mucor lusitanicus CBS 277.49]
MAWNYFLTMLALMTGPVLSATLELSYPEPNSSYKIGDTMLIEWYTKDNGMAASSIVDNYATVVLAYGQRDNLTIDHIMTTKSPLNLGFYQWIIPTTVEPRTDYVIEVGTDASNIAFAGYITIKRRNLVGAAATTRAAASNTITHKALGLS